MIFFIHFILIISESERQDVSVSKRINIDSIISDGVTNNEYIILQKQTGLGKSAVKDILKKENRQ